MTCRRGGAYILVIAITGMASVTALAAVYLLAGQRRIVELQGQAGAARLAAQSGLEHTLALIAADPDWRNNFPSGQWLVNQPLGSASYTVEVIDPVDGDLAVGSDPVAIRVTAAAGEAVQIIEARFEGRGEPMESLANSMFAVDVLEVDTTTINATPPIASNTSIPSKGSSRIYPLAIAPSFSGSGFLGGQQTGTMASYPTTSALSTYAAMATTIAWNSIPGGTIERVVISPQSNPYGATLNPDGIYLIDCGGSDITIRNTRVYGTLVILNAGSGSQVTGAFRIDPALPGYPSLLVGGRMSLAPTSSSLDELLLLVNFNPPGAPYGGETDSDTLDSYPTGIGGIIYVSDEASIGGTLSLRGTLQSSGRIMIMNATVTSTYEPPAAAPPGFASGEQLHIGADGVYRSVQ
jgi:hypothetical protein